MPFSCSNLGCHVNPPRVKRWDICLQLRLQILVVPLQGSQRDVRRPAELNV